MGRREDLLEKIKRNPTNVRFEQLDKLLKMYDYECRNKGGSHYTYKRRGCTPVTVPYHKPVNSVYVKQVIASIETCSDICATEVEE